MSHAPESEHQEHSSQDGHQHRHHHHHHHHHHQHEEVEEKQGSSGHTNPSNRVGKYQIVKTLGEGSFGKVKLAYHLTTGQRVALKIINRKTLSKSDMQGRVEREIAYLRLLRHPHIIKLYDVIKSKEEIIMVIEYAANELFDYIVQKGKLDEDSGRRFFQQIIAAVEYCHRHKIVHRDLKPENLLLDDHLNVKIADFGLSNIMTDGNFLKTSCGSPNYAAPEVISGKLYAGPEVDVWSCGVILYVMLCGRLPFDDEFIPALFKKISNGVYTLPSYLSPGAKNLLTKMLVVNPLNRITMHEIIDDEWFKVGFPEYLLQEDVGASNKELEANHDVIHALSVTMGYDPEEISEALKIGRCPETSEILDAYQLMSENGVLVDDLKKDAEKSTSPPAQWSSLPHAKTYQALSPVRDSHNQPDSTIAILPTSLPQIHRAYMMDVSSDQTVSKISPVTPKKSKSKWHFGIRSRSYPLDVMGEIYRALKNLGAEWIKPTEEDLWTIRVRWKYAPASLPGEEAEKTVAADVMKMQIQLFQLEPNNYLVDFKFDGWENPSEQSMKNEDEISSFSAYPFLHLSTKLIMELAVNSQA